MSFFSDYQRQANSITQANLESDEGLMYDRASGIRGDAFARANLLQGQYSAEMTKTQDEFMEQMGLEQGIPGTLKLLQAGASKLGTAVKGGTQLLDRATEGASKLAQRIAPKGGTKGGTKPTDDFEMEEMGKPSDELKEDTIEDTEIKAPEPEPPVEADESNPLEDTLGITEEDATNFLNTGITTKEQIPEGGGSGGDVSNLGQRFSNINPKEFTTSDKPTEEVDTSKDTELDEDEAKGAEEDVGGVAEDAAEDAGDIAAEAGTGIGELAEAAGGSIAEALGSAIPVVGWIGDLAAVISGAVTASKIAKESNPEVEESQMIQSANTQTQALQARVSGDQFQQRIGASMPSFGSLALAGQRAQQNIALHD